AGEGCLLQRPADFLTSQQDDPAPPRAHPTPTAVMATTSSGAAVRIHQPKPVITPRLRFVESRP
ncbi:MAG: hypothetical protein ACJ8CC_04005, partial [Microvirga sp.]